MPRGIPRTAKNNPVTAAPPLASDHEIGQTPTRTLASDGQSLDVPVIARVSEHGVDQEKMAMLAFMAEPVTIRIATSTDKNAEQVFELNINGKMQFFRRGETKTVPRYFVDRLMRMKLTVFGQEMKVNSEGEKSYQYPASTAIKFDFAILRDDNPLGKSWERAILSEPG